MSKKQSPEQTSDAPSFLVAEAARIRTETNITWGLGIFLGLLLIGYFSFIYKMVGTFLDPENAAFLVADEVRNNADTYIFNAEDRLRQRALPLVSQSASTVLQAVPEFAEDAKAQFDLAVDDALPALAPRLETLGQLHGADWGTGPEAHRQDFALLADTFGTTSDTELPIYTQTAVGLAALNRRVDALLAKEPGDLSDQEVATLRAIVGVLRQLAGGAGAPLEAGE